MKLVLSIFLSIITSLYAITFEEAIANFNSKNYVEAYDQFSELALDDDNLVSLCTQCHNLRHGRAPKRFARKKKLVSIERW